MELDRLVHNISLCVGNTVLESDSTISWPFGSNIFFLTLANVVGKMHDHGPMPVL